MHYLPVKGIHLTDGLTESFFSVWLADLGCGRAGWSSNAPHLATDGGVCRLAKIGFTVVNGGVDNFLVFWCCRPSIEQKYLAALFAQAFLPICLLGVLSVVEVHFARCSVVARVSKIRVQGIQDHNLQPAVRDPQTCLRNLSLPPVRVAPP